MRGRHQIEVEFVVLPHVVPPRRRDRRELEERGEVHARGEPPVEGRRAQDRVVLREADLAEGIVVLEALARGRGDGLELVAARAHAAFVRERRAREVAQQMRPRVERLPITRARITTAVREAEVDDVEREPDRAEIEGALARARGVIARAARELGLSRQALYRRMEKLGLKE